LLLIIDDILNVAKIETGQLIVKPGNCNIGRLFTDLKLFFMEYQTRFKKNDISFSIVTNVLVTDLNITTDKGKLRQIFVNLISNAFKFTEQGKIEVGCKIDDSKQLVFFVSDTGLGIPHDKYDYIFERFSQLEQNERKTLGGNGLGLSIVKGLVNLLGGKVWLESELGKGSTFYFTVS
jgi:signal transduction histidine kinase